MLYAALIFAITVVVIIAIDALSALKSRKAARRVKARDARIPLADQAQQELLDRESGLVSDLLAHKITQADYRTRMRDVATAARYWPRPSVYSG
ncbi:MAG: hypothetical protein LLG14_19920 [Nocardiaceae bacterium]|nr:hypothetical protein [Nocardiaceae bacterium]